MDSREARLLYFQLNHLQGVRDELRLRENTYQSAVIGSVLHRIKQAWRYGYNTLSGYKRNQMWLFPRESIFHQKSADCKGVREGDRGVGGGGRSVRTKRKTDGSTHLKR